jgi:two-component system alkaline phosphatase synthesis response regulator PhoP
LAHKILVVDDDKELRDILVLRLRAQGYVTDEAEDGKMAVEKVTTFQPDLIVLDVMMPVMDGLEACQIIHENRDTSHLPVIFLTARGEDWDVLTGFSKGCIQYLVKPVDVKLLIKTIESVLKSPSLD